MSAVERDLEAYEDMRSKLTEIAISTGAIKLVPRHSDYDSLDVTG
jgi:hypothetical protein